MFNVWIETHLFATMTDKIPLLPTVLLVHGAWHVPVNFQSCVDALKEINFEVEIPRLPSSNNVYTSPPCVGLCEDVETVRTVLKERVEVGEEVLMIMHSYGGMVGTYAVTDNLRRTTRAKEGKKGGVVHLFYQAAYMVRPGTSVISVCKDAGLFDGWAEYVTD
jgi:pimeloyl-ACP methyl ester carboxylesterase